jgi:hypothetical protein
VSPLAPCGPAGPVGPAGPWTFQEIGNSRLVHLDGEETTRRYPLIFARQACITDVSAWLDVAIAVIVAVPASATSATTAMSNLDRGTGKAFGMSLLSRSGFQW